uniref:LIM zinc-binding domain-containing protein n=1 Tax=Cyanistes caeruleus TaxID=156563 RepID=A0A8C0Z7U7_CYACU
RFSPGGSVIPQPCSGGSVFPQPCSGCGSLIRDRFLLRVNERSWHQRCLRCCACGLVLPCSGCGSLIRDRFLLRVNERSWHQRCLRCCACGLVLAGNSCFSRECRLYCRHDYLRSHSLELSLIFPDFP